MEKFKTVDEYIQAQPVKTKEALIELRNCIKHAAPDSIEMFNYGIPAFSLTENRKRDQQIMIAGYKSHVGLYPHPSTMEKFEEELSKYKKGKGSVQFPLTEPVPRELVIRMVQFRKNSVRKNK